MDNLEQVGAIKKALELEMHIANTQQNLLYLLSEKFDIAPDPPVHNVIEKSYPEIIPKTKYNWKAAYLPVIPLFIVIGLLVGIPWLGLVWIVVYRFVIKYRRKKEIEQITNSLEYKNQCIAIDQEYERAQKEADVLFQNQQIEYEGEILPKYQKALEEWTTQHNMEIDEIKHSLINARDSLQQLYDETKIVPLQYRRIETLQYIYDIISTSDFDVKYAIELYDKNEQRKLEQARLYEQQQANQIAEVQSQLMEEQGYLMQEQNEIAAKANRDANIAAAAATVQRHKTNKMLKGMTKK